MDWYYGDICLNEMTTSGHLLPCQISDLIHGKSLGSRQSFSHFQELLPSAITETSALQLSRRKITAWIHE
jgi:hypothetical protein